MKTIIKTLTLSILTLSIFLGGCVKQQFEEPPSNCDSLSQLEANTTIAQLKAMMPSYPDTLQITDDIIISGYVVSNDKYGNFYKELVIQDSTAGISIMLDASYLYTVYPVGQRVVVYCKGLYLGRSGGVIKLGSTYEDAGVIRFGRIQGQAVIDEHIIKTCENKPQDPIELKISQINDSYLYRLIKLDPVQFKSEELGTTWANPFVDPPQSANHTLIDPDGNFILVRTSGYATFAGQELPQGSGPIIAILGKYNSDYQLYVNSTDDAQLTGDRFFEAIIKTFSDGSYSSGGWQNINVSGSINWAVSTKYGNPAPGLTISNYDRDNHTHSACETWYVSPSINTSSISNPTLSFDNAHGYSGPAMEVKISTDWDGDPATISSATWTTLAYNTDNSTTYFVWANSGDIDLSAYKGENVHIAFVYTGTSSSGMTWELDNIRIFNKSQK